MSVCEWQWWVHDCVQCSAVQCGVRRGMSCEKMVWVKGVVCGVVQVVGSAVCRQARRGVGCRLEGRLEECERTGEGWD